MELLESLVEDAKRGDRQAFEQIMDRFGFRLTSYAWSRLGRVLRQRVDAEDIVQETSLKAILAIQGIEWRGESALFSWLCGIASNIILAHSRRYLRLIPEELEAPTDQNGTSPSQSIRRQERFDRLKQCMASLTADQCEVIDLVRLQGHTIREAAERMDRSENATVQLLWRATQKLRELFGETASLHLPPDQNLVDREGQIYHQPRSRWLEEGT